MGFFVWILQGNPGSLNNMQPKFIKGEDLLKVLYIRETLGV